MVLWYSSESNFIASVQRIILYNEFENNTYHHISQGLTSCFSAILVTHTKSIIYIGIACIISLSRSHILLMLALLSLLRHAALPVVKRLATAPARSNNTDLGPTCHRKCLTHLPMDKMATILLTIFSSAFSCMKSFVFWLKFHTNLFPRIQLIITRHCFR